MSPDIFRYLMIRQVCIGYGKVYGKIYGKLFPCSVGGLSQEFCTASWVIVPVRYVG
jgi:hypothetical protein